MAEEKAKKAPPPPWVWPFAILCFLIPVFSLGGAIPTALGVGGGFYCLAVARETKKSKCVRIIHSVAAVSVAWILFAGLALGVGAIQMRFPGLFPSKHKPATAQTQSADVTPVATHVSAPKADPLASVETRREIYTKAMSMRESIERAEERLRDREYRGLSTDVSEKQLEHIKGMHENRLDFTAKWYKISRAELDDVIEEGDFERWPVE